MRPKVFGDEPVPQAVPAEMTVRADGIVDLTAKTDAAGHLDWDVPGGDWTILRIGATPTGKTNHPAMPATEGVDVIIGMDLLLKLDWSWQGSLGAGSISG